MLAEPTSRMWHRLHPPLPLQGFALGGIEERKAVLACLAVFLDTLEAVTTAQRDLSAAAGGDEQQPGSAVASGEGTPAAAADAKPVVLDRYGATVTDLAARALHCCYGGNWPSRLGGIAALECLVPRLPEAALPRLASAASKAVFAVLRILPERASEEAALGSVLRAILQRCGGDLDAPPVAPPAAPAPAKQPKAEKEGEADADAQAAAADGDTEMKEADAEDDGKPAAGEASPAAAKSEGAAAGEADAAGGSPGISKPEAPPLPPLLKTLLENCVQQLLSSRSSSPVRAVASAGVQASAAGGACTCRPCRCRCRCPTQLPLLQRCSGMHTCMHCYPQYPLGIH